MKDIEQTVLALCQEILNLESVSLQDDFFDIGGDSLSAIKLLSRTDALYGEDALTADALFEDGRLGAVAEFITQNQTATA
ncbi:phosphopantetheine-binding protein [Pseudoalteromonas luteoviolacea]|uniref:Carrier domain-containing protein n=2 Tax=Pseudoalteromonas luteoviolacea TaxID=43657 RepID=A0A166ZQR7_9GAMM|nr:phosphopantetheine-binding protein [Pseudoalteromonas luteoviolacea]KZN44562.1 hypothetical protein N476_06065 [Pseudoalteromonas luteoviolacea H33]KZN75364.1 hypothetical protein N477_19075 [Pseudoalteromonas luteoviolacea H33-S]MBQ4879583.1 hypothetical protein [Pseudoalteromonas luteoviolacea]MCF6441365.1 phosphopantetheine-binding protein [Pseudoalteromonas luteoviolacea]